MGTVLSPEAAGPAGGLSRARSFWVLAVLCAGVGLVTAALCSLYASAPDLARATGASQAELTWIIDAYTLVMAGLLLPAGALGDRFGRKGVLVTGLGLFVVTSIALCFAESPSALIALRALLGVAAALILPSTLSIITSTFPPEFRNTAVGIWTAAFTTAGGIAILGAGVLLEFFSWHSGFWSVAVGSVLVFVASLTVPTSRDDHPPPIDIPGSIAAMVSICALVYGLIQAGLDGWTSPTIIGAIALGLAAAAVFVVIQLRRREPLLDVRLFKIRAFGVSAFTVTACFAAIYGLFFLGMQFQQYVLDYSALKATGPIAGMGVPVIGISLASARLTSLFGLRVIVSTGCFLVATSFALMLTVDANTSYWQLFGVYTAIGTGVGLNMAPCTTAIISNVSEAKQGVAASVNHTTREVGTALGVALFGGLLAASYSDQVATVTESLPDPAREASRESVAGALEVAALSGGPAGAGLADAAQSAFVVATHDACLVMLFVMVGVGVIAALWAPPRSRELDGVREPGGDEALLVGGASANGVAAAAPLNGANGATSVNGYGEVRIRRRERAIGGAGQVAGLARYGAAASWRTASRTGGTGVRVGGRLIRAASEREHPAALLRDTREQVRVQARRALGIVDPPD